MWSAWAWVRRTTRTSCGRRPNDSVAGVDPALVTYYFSDKRGLLAASIEFPAGFNEAVAAAQAAPVKRRGRAFMDTMLGNWEDPTTGEILHSIFLTAAHEPLAMERFRETFAASVLAVISESLGGPERYLRANLAASQIIGVTMMRYVWRFGALAELPPRRRRPLRRAGRPALPQRKALTGTRRPLAKTRRGLGQEGLGMDRRDR